MEHGESEMSQTQYKSDITVLANMAIRCVCLSARWCGVTASSVQLIVDFTQGFVLCTQIFVS